jgi:ankyrin repeat protein
VKELRVPLDLRDERGLPAIHVAAGAGQTDAVRACVHMGANPRHTDDQRFSVLHAAASMGHVVVVQVCVLCPLG